jgi:hypothetical protein
LSFTLQCIQLLGSLLGHEKTLEVFSVLLHLSDRSLPYFFGPGLALCLADFLAFVATGHILPAFFLPLTTAYSFNLVSHAVALMRTPETAL